MAPTEPLAREPASKVWGAIHGVSIMLAVVAVLVGFMAGLMYLGQSRRLKHKRLPGGRLRLPSLEWLETANSHAIVASMVMLGVGVLSGMILNLINRGEEAARLRWNDPVVLSTWLMFLWLLGAVVAIAVYRPARKGRKVAYLTVASFIFLVIMLSAGLFMNSRHWGREKRNAECRMMNDELQATAFIPHPSSLILHPSSFIIHHSSFIIPHSSFLIPHSSFIISPGGRPC